MVRKDRIINDDILNIKQGIIGHQVNCKLVMGAGLAKAIKDKYPIVYKEYKDIMSRMEEHKRLGACQIVVVNKNIIVANLFGQLNYGRNKQQTDYSALGMALRNLQRWRNEVKLNNFPTYLPYGLGCGLAGGDWNIVDSIIKDAIPDAYIVRKK